MPATKHATPTDSSAAVDAFMARLDHPRKADIERLRALILAVDPSIAEGVKWNSPSWRTSEYFATTHLRAKSGLAVILHLGAKVRELPGGFAIDDPDGLLAWLGKDRASASFSDSGDLARKASAFQDLLRQWIRHV